MKPLLVKDLMVNLSEYATVSIEATLYDAIMTLEKVHQFDQSHYKHRAVLVFNEKDQVIGKLGLFDILTALESKYSEIGDLERLSGMGLSSDLIKALSNQYSVWTRPLEEVCQDAAQLQVSSIMHLLTENEYIDENAGLDEAIHQLIMGRHQSLIVTQGNEIVGILKLSDVFREICLMIRAHAERNDQGDQSSE